jgi:phosphoribosylamine--glycine ligase/phosphoribosylaminoimidazole synthetase
MKYLIIGNGGREHAILKSLALNDNGNNEYYYVGSYDNPGLDKYAQRIECNNIVKNAKDNDIDLCIIGPEAYLGLGLVDDLEKVGIKCIGPTKELAKLETSKSFARNLMIDGGLQDFCPHYKVFDWNDTNSEEKCKTFMEKLKGNYVVKANGLRGGKGVKVSGNHLASIEEGGNYCKEVLSDKEKVVIEEKLVGDEFSLMSFTDGKSFKHMPLVQDFKRAYDGDKGPNTGSMGSISYEDHMLPFLNEDDINICHMLNELIIKRLQYKIKDDQKYDAKYRGIVYGSFMKTNDGIKIIEYNVRFGDPECINVLSILETNLSDIFRAIVDERLGECDVKFKKEATCCRYLVPNGYPDKPVKGHEIYLDDRLNVNNLICANLSVEEKNGSRYYYELGSRTMAIICTGNNLNDATKMVDEQVKHITGPLFYRTDIGKQKDKKSINYKDAGVNIDEGNKVIKQIQEYVESTFNSNVISKFGDFAGLYQLPLASQDSKNNVLVTSTDGVGTKSIFVLEHYGLEKGYEMLGHDLVSHSVNDILVKGAKPLFFLDYYASSRIKAEYVKYFVKGLSDACKQVGCVLIGGETAEMPDVYQDNMCDLVGTIVGIVEKDKIINGKEQIEEGDLIVGLPSSGPHTNGYSLIRKLVNASTPPDIIEDLCASHKCYYHEVMKLIKDGHEIHGMCHITGGGWSDNSERVLPEGLKMDLGTFYGHDSMPRCFQYLQEKGQLSNEEMYRTFNCGIGMLVYVKAKKGLKVNNVIGEIVK